MKPSPSKMRAIARRLVAYEAGVRSRSETNADLHQTFGAVVEKLRRPLAALMGSAGYRSLIWRAVARADVEVRWLRAIRVNTNGSLELPADMSAVGKAEWAKGELALTTQLLDLLVDFIGEPLTVRLVEDVWPEKALENLVSSKEEI